MIINNTVNKIKTFFISKKFKNMGDGYIDEGFKCIGHKYISIGKNLYVGKNFKLQAWDEYNGEKTGYLPSIIIGNNVSIMDNCLISCINNIFIGNGVLLGDNVLITDNFHGCFDYDNLDIRPLQRSLCSKGPVRIYDNVWIGRNVCILSNVTIGKGAIIGANSVVTHNVPDYSVAVGVPARIVKYRR